MSTAFVAGATGFTGRAVVEVLRASGTRTIAHVRPDSPELERWRQRFGALGAEVDTTPWRADAFAARLAALAPDLVFALLGTTRARGRASGGADSYATVDVALSQIVIDAAGAVSPPPRVVYLSALGSGPRARGAYLAARWQVEEHLRASGLPHVIARPSFVVGERDQRRPIERATASAVDGALAVIGLLGGERLRQRYRSTDNVALARALVAAARRARAPSEVLLSDELQALGGATI
jgi:nucleoside-diphosphate-sugar epimerase